MKGEVLTESKAREWLREEVARVGGIQRLANKLKVHPTLIIRVIREQKPLSPTLSYALGLRRAHIYVRTE